MKHTGTQKKEAAISLLRTNSENEEFRMLVQHLDQYLKTEDGDDHPFYAQYNKIDNLGNVVVAFTKGQAAGCGAVKPFSQTEAEIKRMYVRPEFRGMGIGSGILEELEHWAAELEYKYCILETGKRQKEAIQLYRKCGYESMPNYGQYANVANSLCMRKAVGK